MGLAHICQIYFGNTSHGEDSPAPVICTTRKKRKKAGRTGRKVLNFTSNPALELPILEMVKHEGYGESLAHGKKTAFLKNVTRVLLAPGAALGR